MSKRTKVIRITTTADEIAVWKARGIDTATEARSVALRASATGGGSLTLPRPRAGGPTHFWHVRFSPAEVRQIDAVRGLVPRSKWIADAIGRSESPSAVLAHEMRKRVSR